MLIDTWCINEIVSIVTDQEEQPEPHQEANERVHGLVADRAQENMWADAWYAQRGNLKELGPRLEDAQRWGTPTLHRRGGEAQAATYARVPRLQVQATQENSEAGDEDGRGHEAETQAEGGLE